ncbi:MAG: 2-hydroxyacid dehydrogenase [Alphaproteobacteria bacterium]|nr:2-hydroxyacid dehydrogenase [Alphaproteobacteria bacterium]
MPERVVDLGGLREVFIARLGGMYEVVAPADPRAREATAAVTTGATGVSGAQISALPRLKLVSGFGVGYDRVDIPAARAHGVVVTNTPGLTDTCVADHAMALYLAVARRVAEGDRFVRSGKWPTARLGGLAHRAARRKLGIVGLGRIGMQIARRAAAFEMPIGYHNRHRREDVPYRYFETVHALAEWADVIVTATPGGAGTRSLIDARALAALGAEGVIVNIARGSIIDEAALLRALQTKAIAGAGLDVFVEEPKMDPGFHALDNAVLTPHIAGSTEETWRDCEDMVLENLRRHFAGEKPLTPIPELA